MVLDIAQEEGSVPVAVECSAKLEALLQDLGYPRCANMLHKVSQV